MAVKPCSGKRAVSCVTTLPKTGCGLDIDLTPLPMSKHAEGSTEGKFNRKNRYGRQLARVHAPQYHETLFLRGYPGKQESSPAYAPTMAALEKFLVLTSAQKQCTILRLDAGYGVTPTSIMPCMASDKW
jgi:hypothetical protein